jgi:hypothetical protein
LKFNLACPHKGKSVDLSAVNLLILLDFQTPESTDQQIDRFGLFVSPQELSICQSLDLISTISENISGISVFGFCAVFWERDGMVALFYLCSLSGSTVELVPYFVWTQKAHQ